MKRINEAEIAANRAAIERHVQLQRDFVSAVVRLCDCTTEPGAMFWADEVRRLLSEMPKARSALGQVAPEREVVSGL